ncbi:hypothetical protein [Thermococcus thermotolerans]|uniref:hypothetical protein n=1 Tax=Thermococcus thermotolerans TaxID=2969672 RepID=UPI0021570000|nr:hypothetical protein [Thermococcus thermotolerans]
MIGVISVVIAGIITGNHILFLAPVVYLVSLRDRDLGLVAYLIFALYSGDRISPADMYTYEGLVTSLAFAGSMVLLLDDGLRGKVKPGRLELLVLPFMLLGIIVPEAFIAGAVFYFALRFRIDVRVVAVLGTAAATFFLLRGFLGGLGSVPNQVAVLAGFAIFLAVLTMLRGNLKKVDSFRWK